jgi:hypothetical protein
MADVTKDGTQEQTPNDLVNDAAEFERDYVQSRTGTEDPPDDAKPDDQEPVDVEESTEEPEQPSEPVEGEDQPPEPKTYAVPDLASYGELRGKRATISQLEEAGLTELLFTHAHQGLVHMEKYQEMKPKLDELAAWKEAQEKRQQEATVTQPQKSPEQAAQDLRNEYLPALTQLAEQGAFEKDFLITYPDVAVQLENRFQSGAIGLYGTILQVSDLTKQINEVMEFVGMQKFERGQAEAQSTVESLMDDVAKQMPALSDESVRGRFIDWAIDEKNPIMGHIATKNLSDLTSDDIRGAFAAYVAVTGDGVKSRPKPKAGSDMAGSGAASRGSSSPGGGPPLSEAAQFADDYIKSRSRF